MTRMIVAAAAALMLTACAGGEAEDEPVATPSETMVEDAGDGGMTDDGGDDGEATPAPNVTVAPYEQVEILPFWSSSLGETDADDGDVTGPLASLDYAGEIPDGSIAMVVALYLWNGGREDIDIRDAVDATYIAPSGTEYGADAACGSFIGNYDDGEIVEWAEGGTVYVCRLVPEDASSGGMWRVSSLLEGGRTYFVAVP